MTVSSVLSQLSDSIKKHLAEFGVKTLDGGMVRIEEEGDNLLIYQIILQRRHFKGDKGVEDGKKDK